ncbi:MAG: hypothetical protein AAGI48_03795 [Verrucomicrobiota bacterium]
MPLKDLIVGSHIWFAREGSTVDSTAVVSTALPVFATTKADWLQLGCVEQFEPNVSRNSVKRRCPQADGGKYGVRKEIVISSDLTLNFGLQEMEELNLELLFNSNTPDPGDGSFVPNAQGSLIEGWLHLDSYDQDNVKIVDLDAWVSLKQDSYQFGENLNPHTLIAEVLNNSLNNGNFTNI